MSEAAPTRKPPVDDAVVRRFVPLNGLPEIHRREVIESATVLELAPGKRLGDDYDETSHSLYLLEGELELLAGASVVSTISASSDSARFALSQLRAGEVTARARSATRLMRVDRSLVSTLLIWAQSGRDADEGPSPPAEQARRPTEEWALKVLRSPLFSHIPAANVRKIFETLEAVDVADGEEVIAQGDVGEHYYIVREGRCAVTRRRTESAPPLRLAELGPGDSFGEEALLTGAKRNASVTMLTDGELLRLTKETFVRLIQLPLLSFVDREAADKLVAEGAVWLDTRMPEEQENDGLPGSINLPLSGVRGRADTLDRDATYVCYSNTGQRSTAGAFLLAERGIRAFALEGGLVSARDRRALSGAADSAASPDEVAAAKRDSVNLEAALAKANAALEAALTQKAQAEAARRSLETEVQEDDWDEQTIRRKEQQARLLELQTRLETQSRRASEKLAAAQRQKLELERALREAEADEASRRKRAEKLVERLRAQSELKVRKEEKRLAAEYARAGEQMEKLKRARDQAEERFRKERERLEAELERARERLEAEAQRIKAELESAKQATDRQAEQIREEQKAAERKLREQTEAKLRAERDRLGEDFARTLEQQEKARRELEKIQLARAAAEREVESVKRELGIAEAERRKQIEARRAAERKRVDEMDARASEDLERARKARKTAARGLEEAQAKLRKLHRDTAGEGEPPVDEERAISAEIRSSEQMLSAADAQMQTAERAQAEAQAERCALEQKTAEEQALLEEMRLQLQEETERWLEEERKRSEADLDKARAYAEQMEKIEQERRAKAGGEGGEENLMADVQAQLGDAGKPDDEPARESQAPRARDAAWAAERAVLTRDAIARVNAEKKRLQESLERARGEADRARERAQRVRRFGGELID